jgi:hypothetical protein
MITEFPGKPASPQGRQQEPPYTARGKLLLRRGS